MLNKNTLGINLLIKNTRMNICDVILLKFQCPTACNLYAKQKHPGCKKSARPIRSSIANRYVQPKTLISAEAKK